MVRFQREEKGVIQTTSIPMKPARRAELENPVEETLQQVVSAASKPSFSSYPVNLTSPWIPPPLLRGTVGDAKSDIESKSVGAHGEPTRG